MTDTYITRTYFKRLLISFLCISIVPLAACVLAILYANYVISMENYTAVGQAASSDFVIKLEEAVFEYEKIAQSIAQTPEVIRMLETNQAAVYEDTVVPLLHSLRTGRENRIRIHLLDADSKKFLAYGESLPPVYRPDISSEWGILYRLATGPGGPILAANPYVDGGRQVSGCLGKGVKNAAGELIGYVLIDIYRDTLAGFLSTDKGQENGVILCDGAGLVMLDTLREGQEGRLFEAGAKAEHGSFLKALLGQGQNAHTHAQGFSGRYGFAVHTYLNIADFYSGMELLIRISLVLCGITVLFCLGAASLLAKRLYGPVVEETRRQKDAEIKALQAQISPHFLYNMLNEIKALAKLNRVEEIADFVVRLGRLLRRSITYQEAFVEVRDEILFIKDYLELQQIRYERSFVIEMDIDPQILGCRMPKLILQPIVENSIVHGFVDYRRPHVIRITGKIEAGQYLCFEIYDDGVGVDEDYIRYINDVEKGAGIYGGLGVENVQKRLLLTYGMEYGIHIQSVLSEYTRVMIVLPYHRHFVP